MFSKSHFFYWKFRCDTGVESDLSNCHWQSNGNPQCNINKDVIGIVCHTPELALCQGNATPFRDNCYEVKRINN